MPETLDIEEVERIARLAHLALTPDEVRLYARQLTRILEYAGQIAALDTRGVPPMTHVEADSPVERPDDPRPSLPRDGVMENAPEAIAGLFAVPRVIGGE